MKKMILASIVVMSIVSCGNQGNKDSSTTNDSYNSTRGVENVNGNIPDTEATGALPHAVNPPKDSITNDTAANTQH